MAAVEEDDTLTATYELIHHPDHEHEEVSVKEEGMMSSCIYLQPKAPPSSSSSAILTPVPEDQTADVNPPDDVKEEAPAGEGGGDKSAAGEEEGASSSSGGDGFPGWWQRTLALIRHGLVLLGSPLTQKLLLAFLPVTAMAIVWRSTTWLALKGGDCDNHDHSTTASSHDLSSESRRRSRPPTPHLHML